LPKSLEDWEESGLLEGILSIMSAFSHELFETIPEVKYVGLLTRNGIHVFSRSKSPEIKNLILKNADTNDAITSLMLSFLKIESAFKENILYVTLKLGEKYKIYMKSLHGVFWIMVIAEGPHSEGLLMYVLDELASRLEKELL